MTTTITGATGVNQITDDAITDAKLPAGSVLQVVQATGNLETQPNTTAWVDIAGASIDITPISTSSKILITFNAGAMVTGNPDSIGLRLYRDTTIVRSLTRYGYITGGWQAIPLHLSYLDSPSTTSSVTYKIATTSDADTDYRINSDNTSNGGTNGIVIIAMEIQG